MTTRNKLILLFLFIGVLGLVGSLIVRFAVLVQDEADMMRVVLVGPMSGENAEIGTAMRQGASLFFETFNQSGGLAGDKIILDVLDDKNDAATAKQIANELVKNDRVIAVIGHWNSAALLTGSAIYQKNKIPIITLASTHPDLMKSNGWLFNITFDAKTQASFIANYTRNVLHQKVVTIVHDTSIFGRGVAEAFTATYKRFGTNIRLTREIDISRAAQPQLDTIIKELKAIQDAGTIFLAMDAYQAAWFVRLARDTGLKNTIVAGDTVATNAFTKVIDAMPNKSSSTAKYADKVVVSSPLIYDTAGNIAQDFNNRFKQQYQTSPDWIAAFAYDAAGLIVRALDKATDSKNVIENGQPNNHRQGIRDYLAKQTTADGAYEGVTGITYFDSNGIAKKPVFIGSYNGNNIISALTQLYPIKEDLSVDFIGELKKGKMLYVNDRFMYKTNVVYTGIELKNISDFDLDAYSCVLEFFVWFRYKGNFAPEDIEFLNAVEPIELKKPIEEMMLEDLNFKVYRVKGKFTLDIRKTIDAYGSYIVSMQFRHKWLNRNNLFYVTDVLGLGLDGERTFFDNVTATRLLSPSLGLGIDNAWISQETFTTSTFGKPIYVGFGSTSPEFSRISMGLLISKGDFSIRDIIPSEFFVYIGIFGIIGIVFSLVIDANTTGNFWSMAAWLLRAVFWPTFVLAVGNIVLEMAFQMMPMQYIDVIIKIYNTIWWLLPAWLISGAIERFIWQPLESRTGRIIPNIIRKLIAFTIYAFAILGVITFVLNQTLTGLLATGGLFVMVIGLAVQANIANVFSGIVVNIEHPFSVGDWIKFGLMDEGKVIDITWRTLRLETRWGHIISIPNAQASENAIINYSKEEETLIVIYVHVSPLHNPSTVTAHLHNIVIQVDEVKPVKPSFYGMDENHGRWVAKYGLKCMLANYERRVDIEIMLWGLIWEEFDKAGISLLIRGEAKNWSKTNVPEIERQQNDTLEQTQDTLAESEDTEKAELVLKEAYSLRHEN